MFLSRENERDSTIDRKNEFEALTKNGKVCIQSDLDSTLQLEWTQTLARFIWKSKWIALKDHTINLESFLEKKFEDAGPFVIPRILIMKNSTIDGWGIAQSKMDLDFFDSVTSIKKAFAKMENFDPDNPDSFGALDPEFETFIKKDPFNAANLVMAQPTIYLSNGWPPNAMAELLAHEYGHIYRRLKSQYYSGNEKELVWLNDEVHEEAAAEPFAWTNLYPLYQQYPEIEVFHISKLIFMNNFSPNNFHYVGAAGLQDSFTSGQLINLINYEILMPHLISKSI